jgi:8-amino-7-oxononanoate synthase
MAVEIEGRVLRNFSGSDYLGLAQHPEVIAGLQESAAWLGVGAGLSHLSASGFRAQRELEDAVAQWQGYARGLMFGSAYVANLAVMQTLLRDGELSVQDRHNHGSLFDAARLAGAEVRDYPHLAAEGAMRALRSRPQSAALLATHGIFALDGDMAPLKMLAVLARTENASLYVDDAHGTGAIGPDGRGSVAMAGLGEREVPLQLISLSRALGCAGAVLVGSKALIEHITETARAYLYSSPPPPALATAASKALALARGETWRRYKLAALVARLRRGAQQLDIDLMDSATAIQPLLLGSSSATLAAARHLERAGFLVSAVRPPFVPDGRARLRITLSAAHEEQDIDALLEALAEVMQRVSDDSDT